MRRKSFVSGVVEPAHQDSFLAQFSQPLFSGKSRRADENKIGLAGQDVETQVLQLPE